MNTSDSSVPTALRERVFADLRPVRPLADPWKRALVLAPLGAMLVALVHARLGTRADLGPWLIWGLSLLQLAVGVAMAVAVLREVVPDRALSRRAQIALFALGVAVALAVTDVAWQASGTIAPPRFRYYFWKTCFRGTIEVGLPALLTILLLAARGVIWRPALVGGLAGLAAGLIADASWRTFCDVAEPAHVLGAHFAGIIALAVIGGVAAKGYAWLVASADSRR